MKVSFKIRLMTVGSLAILLVVGILALVSVQRLTEANWWVKHTIQVQAKLEHLLFTIADVASTERAYLITGQDPYLEWYKSDKEDIGDTINSIKELVKDNIKQQNTLDTLKSLIQNRLASFDRSIEVYKTQGRDAALARVVSGKAMEFMYQVHALVNQMLNEETALLERREGDRDRSGHDTRMALIFGTLLCVLFVWLFNYIIENDISTSCQLLLRAADNMEKGRFDAVPVLKAQNEFGELAATLNHLGQNLQSGLEKARADRQQKERAEKLLQAAGRQIELIGGKADELKSLVKGHSIAIKEQGKHMESMRSVSGEASRVSGEASDQIEELSDIAGTIDNIGDELHLTTTAAAIELARAGEKAQGLGSVIDQVKLLSQKAKEDGLKARQLVNRIKRSANSAALQVQETTVLATSLQNLMLKQESFSEQEAWTAEEISALSENAQEVLIASFNKEGIGLDVDAHEDSAREADSVATPSGQA